MRVWLAVDGNGVMRRLYHANGLREGLAERFTSKVRHWREQYGADRVFVAWDSRPTHRQAMLPSYKAHRGATPDAVTVGIAEAAGGLYKKPLEGHWDNLLNIGWEADDLLASVAAEAPLSSKVVVVSDDKDMMAVLTHGVVVARPCEKMAETTHASFVDKNGWEPDRMPDYLALVGDAADGIPGVPGIGELTGKAILRSYGSLDSALVFAERPLTATLKVPTLLRQHADAARLYKRVATLNDRLLEGAI